MLQALGKPMVIIAAVHDEQTPVCKTIEDWEDKFWVNRHIANTGNVYVLNHSLEVRSECCSND